MKRALLAAAALALTGCTTVPHNAGGWVAGKLSVEVRPADAPLRRLASGFELQGDGQRGELRLTSPLGSIVATARWAPGEAVLTTADGSTRYAGLDELSREALGEALPLAALPDWLAGRPWPGAASQPTARGFDQLGWTIDLARRDDGWVEVSRAAPPPVLVRVRLEQAPD